MDELRKRPLALLLYRLQKSSNHFCKFSACMLFTNLFFQDYISPEIPVGFTLTFSFFSTWGDPYYLGLNGIEVFDLQGNPVLSTKKTTFSIAAFPSSVNFSFEFSSNYLLRFKYSLGWKTMCELSIN